MRKRPRTGARREPVLKETTLSGWLAGMPIGGARPYRAGEGTLVLVHRAPFAAPPVDYGLSMVQEPRALALAGLGREEQVLHGSYSGLLGGVAVLMDQYVRLRHRVPGRIVQVVCRVNGRVRQEASTPLELAMPFLLE